MKAKDKDYSKLPKDLFTTPKQGPLTPLEYRIKERLTKVKPVLHFKKK